MNICPICLKKEQDLASLEKHLLQHGYDTLQVELILTYNKKYKSLIDHVSLPDLSMCLLDERYKNIKKYFDTIYSFLLPSLLEYKELNVNKTYSEMIELYKDILCSRLYSLKLIMDNEVDKILTMSRFEFTALYELLDDLLLLKGEAEELHNRQTLSSVRFEGKSIYFSWDNIEFQNRKVVVYISEKNKYYSFYLESSSVLWNLVKDYFFKAKYKDRYFSICFKNDQEIDKESSTVCRLEELLKLEQTNITESICKMQLRNDRQLKFENHHPLQKYKIKKDDYPRYAKNDFIKAAISYCSAEDNVFVIQENNNGKTEQNVMIEFVRKKYIHVLVENENTNRSAHLYIFDKTSTDHLERIYGYYFSDKENKRLHIRQNGDILKNQLNTASRIRVFNHKSMTKYKENLQHYL